MSTSMLYHAFGLKDVKYVSTSHQAGEYHPGRDDAQAGGVPECGAGTSSTRDKSATFAHVPIGPLQVWLYLTVHRLECRRCGALRWPRLPFTGSRLSYTRAFERLVVELMNYMTIAVCDFSCGWAGTWSRTSTAGPCSAVSEAGLKEVRYLAIDEFSLRKGHVYMTIVLDLTRAASSGPRRQGGRASPPSSAPWPAAAPTSGHRHGPLAFLFAYCHILFMFIFHHAGSHSTAPAAHRLQDLAVYHGKSRRIHDQSVTPDIPAAPEECPGRATKFM